MTNLDPIEPDRDEIFFNLRLTVAAAILIICAVIGALR